MRKLIHPDGSEVEYPNPLSITEIDKLLGDDGLDSFCLHDAEEHVVIQLQGEMTMWKNPFRFTKSERFQQPAMRRLPFVDPEVPDFLLAKAIACGFAIYLLFVFALGG